MAKHSLEVQRQTRVDSHLLVIALRRMDIRLTVSGHVVQDGAVTPGSVFVIGPGTAVKCLFRGVHDVLHVQIDNALIDECADATVGDPAELSRRTAPLQDQTIEQLSRSLLRADHPGGTVDPVYVDSVGTAIVRRLLALRKGVAAMERRRATQLPNWRLKRVMDFVDTHIGQQIRLADMAIASGLTPMYFAARFRAATGLRPREYLLRCRIEHAQELLCKNERTIEVALAVGFQSQAHFTSVFKRFIGQPPQAWRRMMAEETHAPGYRRPGRSLLAVQ